MAKVIAFSGSRRAGGNIEKALAAILAATGAETELIRLAELDMRPCLACRKCAVDNLCVHNDDINPILGKIRAADALILGAFPTFASVNALTKTFMERIWPLRHNHIFTRGKIGASVVCAPLRPKELADYFQLYFERYLETDYQGALVIRGVVPCLACGFGESCPVSALKILYGPEPEISEDMFYDFAASAEDQEAARRLGQAVGQAIAARAA